MNTEAQQEKKKKKKRATRQLLGPAEAEIAADQRIHGEMRVWLGGEVGGAGGVRASARQGAGFPGRPHGALTPSTNDLTKSFRVP